MNVVDLTKRLVAFDTVNPPGNEVAAMKFCADLLQSAGFDCDLQVFATATRANLIATRGVGSGAAIGFSGHLDTVPLGAADWKYPPYDGIVANGKLYGRGSSDMKGGVAAFICACLDPFTPPGGIAILLTAGEETGCDGAQMLARGKNLPRIGALVVAESTNNALVLGHKGVIWLSILFTGFTAHAAMPEQGVNAIELASRFIARLGDLKLGDAHEVMGKPTYNVGTIQGGLNTNSVPDSCEITLDLRTIPKAQHVELIDKIIALAGDDATISPLLDLPPVWASPDSGWISKVADVVAANTEHIFSPTSVNYFTDASILTPVLGNPPTVILGPGNPRCAHKTDEWVDIERLYQAEIIMKRLIEIW
ncbi:M20 family metallopeptidase [Cohaesibacter celericrescens]|uniref:M20 family metallopeptidase n=1 Tax=Cohaesibacter celericrescens TaxID=2067669 RepID=UPI00356A9A97